MAKEKTTKTTTKRTSDARVAKRNEKMREMYAKVDKKTQKRLHTTRSLAEKFGLSKTRCWEIVSGK